MKNNKNIRLGDINEPDISDSGFIKKRLIVIVMSHNFTSV